MTGFRSRLALRRRMLLGMADVTQILNAIEQGDPKAAAELLPLVYDELRKLAAARLADEKPGQTLQATALVPQGSLPRAGRVSCRRSTPPAAGSPPRASPTRSRDSPFRPRPSSTRPTCGWSASWTR